MSLIHVARHGTKLTKVIHRWVDNDYLIETFSIKTKKKIQKLSGVVEDNKQEAIIIAERLVKGK